MLRKTVLSITLLGLLSGIFWPSISGIVRWSLHSRTFCGGKSFRLPMGWLTGFDDGEGIGWHTERATIFSLVGSQVVERQWKLSSNRWKAVYGEFDGKDLSEAHSDLALAGIKCGAIRVNSQSGLIAFGCLAADGKTSIEFRGRRSQVAGGITIMKAAYGRDSPACSASDMLRR